MSAATRLSTLLDSLGDARKTLRAEPVIAEFVALVQRGIDTWEATLVAIDGGAEAEEQLAVVSALFDTGAVDAKEIHTAEDMVRLGVGTASHKLVAGLVPVRRELVRANAPVVGLLRRAAVLGRRTRSKWRGSLGRESAQVDRDLKLEEVRVAVKHLVEDLRGLIDLVRERTRPL